MIGRVHGAAGEIPDQPAVDGAGGERAIVGEAPDLVVREQPLQLGGGEIRIGEQPRSFGDVCGLRRELDAARGRSPILPDDRATYWLPRVPVPKDERLALIRDADGRRSHARVGERLARGVERAVEDVARLVLDAPGLGIVLRNLAIAASEHATVGGDDEAGGAGGPGVDGENGLHVLKATDEELGRHLVLGPHALAALGKVLVEKTDERALLRIVSGRGFSRRAR